MNTNHAINKKRTLARRAKLQNIRSGGFALLYSVIVISLILTIAISISDITYKQTILSNLAKDSQIAFYQADSGIECGMYWDATQNTFVPVPMDPSAVPDTLQCGDRTMKFDDSQSDVDYFVYELSVVNGSDPCFTVIFDKTTLGAGETGKIQSRGHNTCEDGPRKVERALEVVY